MDRYSWHHKICRSKAVQITKKYTIVASTSISPYLCTLFNITFDLFWKIGVCVWGGGGGGGDWEGEGGVTNQGLVWMLILFYLILSMLQSSDCTRKVVVTMGQCVG